MDEKTNAFLIDLGQATSVEEVKEVCKKHNINIEQISDDEIKDAIENKEKELSEEDLEKINGGVVVSGIIAMGLAAGSMAFYTRYGYNAYKDWKKSRK